VFEPELPPALFMPVVEVPAVEVGRLFVLLPALAALVVPVAMPLPVDPAGVLLLPLALCVLPPPLVAPAALALLPLVPVALFWLPALLVLADVPVGAVLPVGESAAKAGAAASNPNAQTEANRRPLSMCNSLPVSLPKRSAPHG
jgi:hypothetical protein